MISKPLLKQSFKANWILWVVVTLGSCLMLGAINLLMGSIDLSGNSIDQSLLGPYIEALMEKGLSLEGLFGVLGIDSSMLETMQDINILDMVTESYYGMSGIMLPLIYVIIVSNSLIASQVDRGSMAYVLSTPTKRNSVSITQAFFLIGSLLLMVIFTAATGVITEQIAVGSVDVGRVVLLNLGTFLALLAVSGICFMASSIFNLSKHSLAMGGGLTIFFFLCKILGMFGSETMGGIKEMSYFGYASIFTLFDTSSIIASNNDFIWKFVVLLVIGILTYLIGIIKFNKKDLPL